jgi:HEPN domain-containing protein
MAKNKSILLPKDYSKELFKIAQGDLQSAEVLMKSFQSGRAENILYMIQQSVEKTIKSVLVFNQISFPMVHDLGILIALLPPAIYPPGEFDLTALNPYASIRRYEEGLVPLEFNEVQGTFDFAKLVLDWGKTQLELA